MALMMSLLQKQTQIVIFFYKLSEGQTILLFMMTDAEVCKPYILVPGTITHSYNNNMTICLVG